MSKSVLFAELFSGSNRRGVGGTMLGGLLLLAGLGSGCAPLNDPGYYPPSGSGYHGSSYDDDYYRRREAERNYEERRRLERERERLEDERRRLEDEKRREARSNPPPARAETCPSGFTPSEEKCSPAERARGCKDVRLSNGMGCVRR